ncbi:hypothetical protein MLD38_039734 [Melastoma candidum]|uniref:Uncharacterized protein n=1 Tax=Melastoma candidum TaxID=119954 RepID=A0ACB9L3R7_9MYRT|nr:hypothetical protein MLD38_039734 [Melastoma candidum]
MGLNLFDGAADDVDDISKIEVDADYARRFEHNKKREDLQRFEELKKKGLVDDPSLSSGHSSEDSESDSESSGEFYGADWDKPSKKGAEFFSALIKVRNRDPIIKQEDVSLFESDGSDGSGEDDRDRDRKRKLYLKDVAAKQLIEEGPEFDDETAESSRARNYRKSYNEEQDENRRAFLEAVEATDEDGDSSDLLVEKKREDGGRDDKDDAVEFEKRVEEYFGTKEKLDENEAFLKDYFLNEMWIDKGGKKEVGVGDEELEELEDDEEEIWKQEDYENTFRHEEDLSDVIWGHSRSVDGSVRKVDNARKKQRKSKEERLKAAELERKEELKHLKNLKKEEMKEKLKKLREISGIGEGEACQLDYAVLEDDFDPDKHDQVMKRVFDEKYYAAEDVDPNFGSDKDDEGDSDMEKPDFSKEDELLGLPKGWDVSGSSDGFLAARERSLKIKPENDDDGDFDMDLAIEEMDMQNEDVKFLDEGKRKRKQKLSLLERAKEAMLEEYYKLDYEDTIGDLKTRFKYAKIKPNRYGLKPEEILMLDDKDLNQYISLKRLAPYREKEWKVPHQKRLEIKRKNDGDQEEGKSKKHKFDELKKHGDDDRLPSTSAAEDENGGNGPGEDLQKLSRNARRRRRQAEFKLTESRLKAYGKIPPKSEKKKNK